MLRLLLFTFGRTAIAGRVQTQEKASGYRKSCRRAGRLAEMLRVVVPFPASEQPWDRHWALASAAGNLPSALSGTALTPPFP